MAGQKKPAPAIRAPVLTVAELCDSLQVHRATLYQLIHDGKIPYFRVGSDYRFDRQAIEEWRQSQKFPDPASVPKRGRKPRSG